MRFDRAGREPMQPYGPPPTPYYPPTAYYPPPGYYPPYGVPYPFAVAPPRIPRPRGVPRRGWFLAGAVGQFIAAGLALTFGVLSFFPTNGSWGWVPFVFTWLGAAVGVAVGLSLLFQLFGFNGLWRNYGSLSGAAAVAYGFAAITIFMFASVLAPVSVEEWCEGPWWCSRQIASWGWAVVLVGYAMLGAMFIVHGSAFIANRFFLGNPGAAVASGVLHIIAGSFIASFILALYGGFFILAPALIVGGVVLVRAPLPMPPSRGPAPIPAAPPAWPPTVPPVPPVAPP